MLWIIKQVFIVLLDFSGSLATKFVSLGNEPYRSRTTSIDLNPVELNYYPFMISLAKCNVISNIFDDSSPSNMSTE